MTTALSTQKPTPTVEETLEGVFLSHGYQQEAMMQEYLRVRRKAQDDSQKELDPDELEFDVRSFLSKDETRRKAAMKLASDATNPVVSRETQMAVLKQLVQDYFRGKKRPGLGALTVMKAVELLNKMGGYEAPEKVEHTHEHKVAVLPIVGQAFTGSLPPLQVSDVHDEEGVIDAVAISDYEAKPDSDELELRPEDF